jgi:DNA polymerase-3 subunit delta
MASAKKTAQGRAYLYLGPEIGEKQDALNELRASLRSRGALEETSWYAGETPVNLMAAGLRNGSLFSDTRLFLIKNAELIKKDDAELLASCMANPQDGAFLVLISEETKLDPRLEKAADPKNKRIFWELYEDRKTAWVENFFRREGFRIGPDGVETILELVENNTGALRQECSRLCLFILSDRKDTAPGAVKDNIIDAETVEQWLSHNREETAFTLFSRLAAGDLSRSVETLHSLLDAKESPQAILSGLVWSFRRLRDYLALAARGETGDLDLRKIGITSPRARKDYANFARRLPSGIGNPADSAISLIAEFDLLLRENGAGPAAFLLDLLVYKLVSAPGKGRERWYWY